MHELFRPPKTAETSAKESLSLATATHRKRINPYNRPARISTTSSTAHLDRHRRRHLLLAAKSNRNLAIATRTPLPSDVGVRANFGPNWHSTPSASVISDIDAISAGKTRPAVEDILWCGFAVDGWCGFFAPVVMWKLTLAVVLSVWLFGGEWGNFLG